MNTIPLYVPEQNGITSMLLFGNFNHKPPDHIIAQYQEICVVTLLNYSIVFIDSNKSFPYAHTQTHCINGKEISYAFRMYTDHGIKRIQSWAKKQHGFALVHILERQPREHLVTEVEAAHSHGLFHRPSYA